MQVWPDVAELVALVVEAAGVLLLFREVWRGHTAEGHEHNFVQLERIEQLMQAGRWQDAYAEFYVYQDPTPAKFATAQAFAAQLGPAACKQALQSAWLNSGLAAQVQASRQRWIYWTSPGNLTKRKRLLWLGSALVLLALLLQGALFATKASDGSQGEQSGTDDGGTVADIGRDWKSSIIEEPSAIRFDAAEASLRYRMNETSVDLTSAVCALKQSLTAQNVGGVLVVGRYDQRELRGPVRRRWSSNQALAQARADAVADFLATDNECAAGLGAVVRLVGGPKYPGKTVSADQLAADRSVEVFGLVTRGSARLQ